MFSEPKNSVYYFSSQLTEIRSERSAMKSDICIFQERFFSLESSSKNDYQLSELLNKILECEKCLYNIVVHSLLESPETSPSSRTIEDNTKLNEGIQQISMSIKSESKLFRFDRPNYDKPSHLKIVFPIKEQTSSFVIEFNTSKRSVIAENKLQTIHISRDRSLLKQ